jgi:altered-inheritance-of-mitochondria protein 5
VRWVQRTDWAEVREGLEGSVARLLGSQPTETAIEKTVGVAEAVKAKAGETFTTAKNTAGKTEKKVVKEMKEKLGQAEKVTAGTKAGAHEVTDSIRNSGGTVDAARGAVRDVISKGIEKGKEAIGM